MFYSWLYLFVGNLQTPQLSFGINNFASHYNLMGGVGSDLLATSRIPCESVGHLIYFPRFLTRESAVRVWSEGTKCLLLRHREEESALEQALRVSVFTMIFLFASFIYYSFSFLVHTFAKAILNAIICRSVLYTRPSNYSIDVNQTLFISSCKQTLLE